MQNWPGNGVTHSFDFCRIFQGLAPGETATVSAWVLYEYNGEIIWDEEYWFKIVVGGGPINIDLDYKQEARAFKLHRSSTGALDGAYPWYLFDFGYDPFGYRQLGSTPYTPVNMQPCNRFKAWPEWVQPSSIKIQYKLTTKGVFLNQDADLAVLGSGRDPRKTTLLEATASKNALVSWDGQTGNEDETVLSATYYYVAEDGTSVQLEEDYTPFYRVAHPDGIEHPEKYCTFRSHRPTSMNEFTYGNCGPAGPAHLYQVFDMGGAGISGVWVQERFWFYVDPHAYTNDQYPLGFKWTTTNKEYRPPGYLALYGADGVFDSPDYLTFPLQDDLPGHEYWAATNKGARRENQDQFGQYYLYPERIVRGANQRDRSGWGFGLELTQ